jgi:hypothetical protein
LEGADLMGISLALVALGASAIGTGISVNEAKKAERKEKRAARVVRGERLREADAERERGRRLRSTQRAAFGAAGVNADFGSPQSLQFRSVLDSIDRQGRIIRGAQFEFEDTRRRARANTVNAYAAGFQNIAGALSNFTPTQSNTNSTVPGTGPVNSGNPFDRSTTIPGGGLQ